MHAVRILHKVVAGKETISLLGAVGFSIRNASEDDDQVVRFGFDGFGVEPLFVQQSTPNGEFHNCRFTQSVTIECKNRANQPIKNGEAFVKIYYPVDEADKIQE
jgi:hypothetical protein